MTYYLPMIMAISANIFYHVFLKIINQDVNPLVALFFSYTTAAITTVVLYSYFYGLSSVKQEISNVNWACYALGVAIVLLEVGFILAYRAGWQINSAAIFSNAAIGVILIPIGLYFFKENVDLYKLSGISFCVVGLILINK